MYLKNAKKKFTDKWSIANKFNFIYTTASITTLLIVALMLSWALSVMMTTAEKQFQVDEVLVIQSLLKENPHLNALTQEVNGVPAGLKNASYRYYMRILDNTNKVVMQTAGEQEAAQAPFPLVSKNNWTNSFVNWKSPQKDPYLLISAPIQFDHLGKPSLSMQMALNIKYPEKLISVYRSYIALFFILFVILFILLGNVLAKNAFKSLYELIKETELITIAKLSKRIDHREWPKELASLGSSFNKMLLGIESAFTKLNQCTNELAHELRMPINNLIGGTEITLSKERDSHEYKDLLESNLEEFRRISKLTDNILFLARTEINESSVISSIIDLHKEVKIVCEFYKNLAIEKGITISYTGSGHIYGEEILIQRALTNLLDNAIKYTASNGLITVNIKAVEDFIEIAVQDNGIGISEHETKKIFERFYKLTTYETKVESWGLGLAIVKSIMELHKGFVSVISEPGKGTTFILHFPKPA